MHAAHDHFATMDLASAEHERRELLALGATVVRAAPSTWPTMRDWFRRVKDVFGNSDEPSLIDARLAVLSSELRQTWLNACHIFADRQQKSPLRTAVSATAAGTSVEFGYERDLQPTDLEARCARAALPTHGWHSDHVLFSSAQSALTAILHWARSSGYWDERTPHLAFAGGYFETRQLLDVFRGRSMIWKCERSVDRLLGFTTTNCRTMLLEPIFYGDGANVFDLSAFERLWQKLASDAPDLLILDTTLTGPLFPLDRVLRVVRAEKAPVVVSFRSGLKLDQAGLELTNFGVASIHQRASQPTSSIGDELRRLRTVLGLGLTFDEISALEAPWIFDRSYFEAYAASVFKNNWELARALDRHNSLFAQVLHPQFAQPGCTWAHAPYCILRLPTDDPGLYSLLERIITSEAAKRGIQLDVGGSFGFRGDRFEVIVPKPGDDDVHLRIAMGARGGWSSRETIALMSEIALYPDMPALANAYMHVVESTA